MAYFVNNKNMSKSLSLTSDSKSFALHPLRPITANQWKSKEAGDRVVSFLIKTIALETVRRFSRSRCPFLWNGLQALQIICYPPLKWIHCWNPFGTLIKGMQMISRPLLVLSIANAFSDHSDRGDVVLNDRENSTNDGDSQLGSESPSVPAALQHNLSLSNSEDNPQVDLCTDWMNHLCKELETQGITLPERVNEEELKRFYVAANGDISSLLSSVKKTISWRGTYRILSLEELEMWSNVIFWHGLDVKHRPCLIIRLGLACMNLPSHDRPRLVQAVVSQVEHGVLNLVDEENPEVTVLLDCQGVSPLRFPMQTTRYCCNILQNHFPNILGCLIIIRVPPVARVIAQTFIQVLKPATKQKLRIYGDAYQKVLAECFETVPSYLGGPCTCTRCAKLGTGSLQQNLNSQTSMTESVPEISNTEYFTSVQQPYEYDMIMDVNCTRTLRAAVIGILIIWVLIAFIEGIYNPESRPTFIHDA